MTEHRQDSLKLVNYISKSDKTINTEVYENVDHTKSTEVETQSSKKPKKKSKIKTTFNSVFRSLRSGADKLLTNFLSSGNYNRFIIATSAATAAVKRSSITDTDEEDDEKCNITPFRCGPQLTISLGEYTQILYLLL